MNHAEARVIAEQYAPQLHIDEMALDMPIAFIVRASEGSRPFSITLFDIEPSRVEAKEGKTREQVARDQEVEMLKHSLDQAKTILGVA